MHDNNQGGASSQSLGTVRRSAFDTKAHSNVWRLRNEQSILRIAAAAVLMFTAPAQATPVSSGVLGNDVVSKSEIQLARTGAAGVTGTIVSLLRILPVSQLWILSVSPIWPLSAWYLLWLWLVRNHPLAIFWRTSLQADTCIVGCRN